MIAGRIAAGFVNANGGWKDGTPATFKDYVSAHAVDAETAPIDQEAARLAVNARFVAALNMVDVD